ncbi:MAG: hypothetical protein Q4C87_02385 [Actinomycetaceae bacterium]|nr:hypothetical protein [Actinomycetaceae bacterium]
MTQPYPSPSPEHNPNQPGAYTPQAPYAQQSGPQGQYPQGAPYSSYSLPGTQPAQQYPGQQPYAQQPYPQQQQLYGQQPQNAAQISQNYSLTAPPKKNAGTMGGFLLWLGFSGLPLIITVVILLLIFFGGFIGMLFLR